MSYHRSIKGYAGRIPTKTVVRLETTHREGDFEVVLMKSRLFRENEAPEEHLLWFFERFARSCSLTALSCVSQNEFVTGHEKTISSCIIAL